MFKIFSTDICCINIKWGIQRVILRPSYIQDARFLKVKTHYYEVFYPLFYPQLAQAFYLYLRFPVVSLNCTLTPFSGINPTCIKRIDLTTLIIRKIISIIIIFIAIKLFLSNFITEYPVRESESYHVPWLMCRSCMRNTLEVSDSLCQYITDSLCCSKIDRFCWYVHQYEMIVMASGVTLNCWCHHHFHISPNEQSFVFQYLTIQHRNVNRQVRELLRK